MNALQELKDRLNEEELNFVLEETIANDYKQMILYSNQKLKDTLDLEELIGEYIQLKGMGDNDLNENGIKAEEILNKLYDIL